MRIITTPSEKRRINSIRFKGLVFNGKIMVL
jgi:hypothetical protein